MTSNELVKILTRRLGRRIKVCHINPIAEELGKSKRLMHENQFTSCYYWDEGEIELVVNKLK